MVTKEAKVWVVKIGSSIVTKHGKGIDQQAIENWCGQIVNIEQEFGIATVVVCSGSIAEGMVRLGWQQKPKDINKLQAAAAIGQMGLVQGWQTAFRKYDKESAQILLTHADIANRERYLNSRGALQTLLDLNVISIINENDTVTTDEIKLGDNDNLGAMVANLVQADRLVLLTDQDGLMDKDPSTNADAKLISEADANDSKILEAAGGGGRFGSGGMRTKILAARRAASSGCVTHICNGHAQNILVHLAKGERLGTTLLPQNDPLVARKQWLMGLMHVHGSVELDAGAVNMLQNSGKSLLPVGVVAIQGHFERGDLIACIDSSGLEIARGLTNYNSSDCEKIKGIASKDIAKALGYFYEPELIHRDNLVLLTGSAN